MNGSGGPAAARPPSGMSTLQKGIAKDLQFQNFGVSNFQSFMISELWNIEFQIQNAQESQVQASKISELF